MTELGFLIDLLLNHKLPKATRDLIASRIKEVEERFGYQPQPVQRTQSVPAGVPTQAASTMALMAKHGIAPGMVENAVPAQLTPDIPAEVAQTPAAIAALASRAAAIANANQKSIMTERRPMERTSPRKF